MRKNAIVLLFIILLAGIAVYQNISGKNKALVLPAATAPTTNYMAPSFHLLSMDGKDYAVGGQRDKPLFLNFWASWCGPCELEAPDLKRMYDKYKNEIDMYGVNITKNDNLADARDFVKEHNLTFPILLDKEGSVSALYRFQVVPTSFLIDRNGVVVDVINLMEPKALEKKIKQLISK